MAAPQDSVGERVAFPARERALLVQPAREPPVRLQGPLVQQALVALVLVPLVHSHLEREQPVQVQVQVQVQQVQVQVGPALPAALYLRGRYQTGTPSVPPLSMAEHALRIPSALERRTLE